MEQIDSDIEEAIRNFNYYLRNRQKYIDNPKKFKYYDERLLTKEETLIRLFNKKRKR